ncbi:MAG: LysR family transcriptional regulator [Oscillospiraceae bacterium]
MYNSHLTAFVHVADCGSFSKAAEKLFISATAVMKQINALEAHLGLKLLVRTNQGIQLTSAGDSIYKDAKFRVEDSAQAISRARQRMASSETTFCVGTSMLNPCKAFMDLWYQVNDDFPGYKLHIVPFEDDHDGILAVISALGERYDFLVGVCDSALWRERCNFVKLGEYKRCFAVPVTHRLASKQKISLDDLHGETLMMVGRGDSPINDREREDIERNYPQIRIVDTPYFYDIGVFNRAVQTGSILSSIEYWKDIHPALVTIPMEWEHTIPYGLLYPLNPDADILRIVEAITAVH